MVNPQLHSRADRQGKRQIFLVYTWGGSRVRLSLGVLTQTGKLAKVEREYFSKGKVKNTHPQAAYLNNLIQKGITLIEKTAYYLSSQNIAPTPIKIKEVLTRGSERPGFWEVWRMFQKEVLKYKEDGYVITFIGLKNVLESFESTTESIDFPYWNKDQYNRFVGHLTDQGFAQSTIKQRLTLLKVFLNFADSKELFDANMMRHWRYKARKATPIPSFFTASELIQLEKMTFPESVTITRHSKMRRVNLSRVLKIMLFYCYTGLRYKDGQNLTKENIRGNTIFHYEQKVKKDNQQKPLPEKAKKIFRELGYSLAPTDSTSEKSNQDYYSMGVKELARRLGKNQIYHVRGKPVELWTQFSPHSTRRTFVSVMLSAGYDIALIQKITGHETVEMVLHYDRRQMDGRIEAVEDAFGKKS